MPGDYTVRSVRLASAQTTVSRGFASPTAGLGGGTVTVRAGGEVARPVSLGTLNGGAGVTGGRVRLTDASGSTATVDLSTAASVQDVLDTVNAAGVDVTLTTEGDRFVLTDTSGGGRHADDRRRDRLGRRRPGARAARPPGALSAATTSSASPRRFQLDLLNDGLGPKIFEGAADIRVTGPRRLDVRRHARRRRHAR